MSFNISAKTPTDVLPSIAVVLSQKNSSGAQGQLHWQVIDNLPPVVIRRSLLACGWRHLYCCSALAARGIFESTLACGTVLHQRKIVAIGTRSELKALAPLAGTIVVGFRGVKWQALQPELGKVAVSDEIRAVPRVGFARERQATAKRCIVTRAARNSSSTRVPNGATDDRRRPIGRCLLGNYSARHREGIVLMSKVWTIARRELGWQFWNTTEKGSRGPKRRKVEAWLDQLAKELKDLPAASGTERFNLNQMAR